MSKHKTQIPTRATVAPHARVSKMKRPAVQMTSRVEKKSVATAPPVYRPQPTPQVLQKKELAKCTSPGACKPGEATQRGYHPQPVPKVLQKKDVRNLAPNKSGEAAATRSSSRPSPAGPKQHPSVPGAPRIMRSRPAHVVRSAAIQRALARPGGPPPPGPPPPASVAAASAAAALPCPTHPDILLDEEGDCYRCMVDQEKVQRKPNQVKKRTEVVVTMHEWSQDNRKVAGELLGRLSGNQITHRGNKPPQDEGRPTVADLVNHEESGAPVWFTVGGAGTGADIEKYAYHHVLTLNRSVDAILAADLRQVLNHSEGSSGESTWPGYLMKTNEAGCFAVSRNKIDEFYRQFVTRHELRTPPKPRRR